MLGRGVKRKRGCSEELATELVPSAAPGAWTEVTNGAPLPQNRSDTAHLQQRQLVLTLCLDKLQRYQAGTDLGLHRSVLLVNTLRQIQEDMNKEVPRISAGSWELSAPQRPAAHPDVSVRSPAAPGSLSDFPLAGLSHEPYLFGDGLREDIPLTCPGCAVGDREGLSSSSTHCPPTPVPSAVDSAPSASSKSQPLSTHHPPVDPVTAMGYLSDLAPDDIFEDIDTSMYDTSDLPTSWAVSSYWPLSLSPWGEEELKMCSLGHASHAGTLQSCLADLNDLDQIMEILVNS